MYRGISLILTYFFSTFLLESECACTLPSQLTGNWWDSRTNGVVTFSSLAVTSGWQLTINAAVWNTFTCVESDSSYLVFRSDTHNHLFGVDYYAIYCLEYSSLTTNSYSYYVRSNVEDFTGKRVFLLDQLQDPSYTSTAQYCNHTNGPDTREYNVLVKQDMQQSVHLQQYFPDPLLGVFSYTVNDGTSTSCAGTGSVWDGCYVNGGIDRTTAVLNYTQCATLVMGSTSGVFYNVANVTESGSTYYTILINSDGTDPIFTCIAVSQSGSTRSISTNPGGCAANQVPTSRTSHADSVLIALTEYVFTTTTSTTTMMPTTSNNDSSNTNPSTGESSSGGSNTAAVVGAVLSILLLIAIIIIAFLIYQKYFKGKKSQIQHRQSLKGNCTDIKPPLPPDSDFTLSENPNSKDYNSRVKQVSLQNKLSVECLEYDGTLNEKTKPLASSMSPFAMTSTIYSQPEPLNEALRRNLTPLPEQPRPPTSSAIRTKPLPPIHN
ncbi:unnamed protein product [Mytilus coruscus]|uniref:DUF7042 domain-containing protein n=1 Tax=Mytilus coruscus TaxID=42192 RepID=A0A6J8BBH7_MYTCO|nr:unnamed protein product [Mytilus coruscus]